MTDHQYTPGTALMHTRCCYCGAGFYLAEAPFICDLCDPVPGTEGASPGHAYPHAERARAQLPIPPVLPLPFEVPWSWARSLKKQAETLLGRSLPPASMKLKCEHVSHKQRCPRCHATLPDNARTVRPFIVSLLGPTFVGKSHYLAAVIDVLAGNLELDRPGLLRRHGIDVCGVGETDAEYRDRYYRPVYEQRETLAQTPPLHINPVARVPLVYAITERQRRLPATNLSLFDVPGENALDRRDLVKHGEHILHSDAVICMIGPADADEDARAALDARGARAIDKLIEAAERHPSHGRKGRDRRALDIPVAIVITKSDVLAERGHLPAELADTIERTSFTDPRAFDDSIRLARGIVEGCRALRELPARLEREFGKVGYFAVSSLGFRPDGTNLPRRPEPHRVEEPLLWLLTNRGDSLWGRR